MAIYTYEVDHGNESPRIGGADKVNGGKLIATAFSPYITQATEAKEKLRHYLFANDKIDKEVYDKILEIIEPL